MKVQNIKNIIAEWLEERELPNMTRRKTPPIDLQNLSSILAIVGPRRAGKTFFMYQLISDLLMNGFSKNDILFIDFEDYRLVGIEADNVESILTAFVQLSGRHPRFLFFDEVQNLPQWSRVLRTLHNQQKYNIVVSGSNSKLLSFQIATELRGRYRDVLILPFSFSEILRFRKVEYNERTYYTPGKGELLRIFDEYIHVGGFPEIVRQQTNLERHDLLQSYFRTLFYHDLLERYSIRTKNILETIMSYSLDTFSDLFSISSFSNFLKSNNVAVSKQTVSSYLGYLQETFFIIVNEKFDMSPRKRLMNPKKHYLLDVGFASLSSSFSEKRGQFLENIVAIELFRRREEMFYFKNDYECDFVLKKATKIHTVIQVCWELNERNRKRESKGLAAAISNLKPKNALILTYDQEGEENINGETVSIIPVWKWLLTEANN